MTDIVNISPGHVGNPRENARTFKHVAHSDGWIVPDTDTLLADVRDELDAGPYNAFTASHSASSLDVTIATGEAAVEGVALARDEPTTVTLAANATDQVVYLGWASGAQDTVVVGLDADFTTDDPRIPIWEFDTDGSGVTAARDQRDVGAQVTVENTRYETDDGSGVQVDDAASADQIAGIGISQLLRADQDDAMGGELDMTAHAIVNILRAQFADRTGDGAVWDIIEHDQSGDLDIRLGGNPVLTITDEGGFIILGGGNADFGGGQLEHAVIENRSDRPTDPSVGQIIYRVDKD